MKSRIDTWEDMLEQKTPLPDIKEGRREFEIMKKAAENGVDSAQHSMGMWYQEVAKNLENAKNGMFVQIIMNTPPLNKLLMNCKIEVEI